MTTIHILEKEDYVLVKSCSIYLERFLGLATSGLSAIKNDMQECKDCSGSCKGTCLGSCAEGVR